jgi:hypothetical protein
MISRLILFVGAAAIALAQGPLPPFAREATELLGTSATTVTDLHSVAVTRTSGTVLSIGNGASATAPQSLRFSGPTNGYFTTRQITSAMTLTSASGGGTGNIFVYAIPVINSTATPTNGLQFVVISNLGGTLNCTGSYTCNVVQRGSQQARQAIASGIYIAAWSMTAGSPATFDVGGGVTQSQGGYVWLNYLYLTNVSGGAVNVTITDGLGRQYGQTLSIAANTTYLIDFSKPGYERFFERGVVITAGTVSAINVMTRWINSQPTYNPAAPN